MMMMTSRSLHPHRLASTRFFSPQSAPKPPSALYQSLVSSHQLLDDPVQRATLTNLDNLFDRVVSYAPHQTRLRPALSPPPSSTKPSFFASFFAPKPAAIVPSSAPAASSLAPRGLYLYGGPGSGKTMLMNLFYTSLPITRKRRVHFHEFMLEVHRTLHDLARANITGPALMESLASEIHAQAWVLCFDEFQVTDIADAMVIQRLFTLLFAPPFNLVMVATSNREPDELYKNGLQRALFLPFIADLKAHCRIVNMLDSRDYRLLAARETQDESASVYICNPQGSVKGLAKFQRLWEALSKNDETSSLELRVQGRVLKVPRAARHTDVARFSFQDLCGQPLGAADYYAIAGTFHTVFLEDLPQLSLGELNQLRRFITLIDTLYDQGTVLVVLAQTPIEDIFKVDPASVPQSAAVDVIGDPRYALSRENIDEVFAFARTRSRLQEMQTREYLEKVSAERRSRISPVRFFSQLKAEEGDLRQIFDRYDANDDGFLQTDKELQLLLEEFEMFASGNRHISNLVEIKKQLDPNQTGNVEWDVFRKWMKDKLQQAV